MKKNTRAFKKGSLAKCNLGSCKCEQLFIVYDVLHDDMIDNFL